MKRILITGSLGLVGSACKELFLKKGWEITEIDNDQRHKMFGTPSKDFGGVDIRNQKSVEEVFQLKKFDAIIHAAGQPSHDYATDHVLEDYHINATGTLHLLEATRKYCPEATFLYVSTDKVYGENMSTNLIERDTRYIPANSALLEKGFDETLGLDFAGDRSLFGCSKAAADMYVQVYAAKFGMKTACFRPGCITGKNHAGAPQHGFLAYLAKCIKEGKTYYIHGNGKQVRDQIQSSDLASAFWAFINAPHVGSVYNIGGGPDRSVSVLEAIRLLLKEIGTDTGVNFQPAPERAGDRKWDVHDISKFRRDYPYWEYKYSLSDIIKDLC